GENSCPRQAWVKICSWIMPANNSIIIGIDCGNTPMGGHSDKIRPGRHDHIVTDRWVRHGSAIGRQHDLAAVEALECPDQFLVRLWGTRPLHENVEYNHFAAVCFQPIQ